MAQVLEYLAREAARYLESLGERPVRLAGEADGLARLGGGLPQEGVGALAAVRELFEAAQGAAVHSAGPRFFHFVVGGATPAALGGDWLTSVLDQNAFAWVASPLGAELERLSLAWLKDLFMLPADWSGVLTSGATMGNFVGLAAAREWWGERLGVSVARHGLAGLPPLAVLSSGYIHASAVKALAMLGIGQARVRTFARDAAGRLDLEALEEGLAGLGGRPAILVANAGEVNAGDFDPIGALADLAERYRAWLHVDGAFGLFARLTARAAELTDGMERAHSVSADGHKWLNVPYDCGFCFVREGEWLARSFGSTAPYLPRPDDPRPNFGHLGPEMSRRARALAVWATLRAYGRRGYREMVEGHLELAQHLARRVDEAPDLERLAPVPLNIVCFRYRPLGLGEGDLDALNGRLGEAILADGRVYAGTTRYAGKVALRPAIVNWRTTRRDVDLLVEVVRELGAREAG